MTDLPTTWLGRHAKGEQLAPSKVLQEASPPASVESCRLLNRREWDLPPYTLPK